MENKKKIIAVASFGGHLIQLLRIMDVLEEKYDVTYVSTATEAGELVGDKPFHVVTDFNRKNPLRLFSVFYHLIELYRSVKPAAIISTGAAPGLMAIIAGKLLGIKTIWVDSIANAAHLSGSGKVAVKFADLAITQWENVAKGNVKYFGNVFGNI